MKKLIPVFYFLLFAFYFSNAQQIKTPSPSTPQFVKQDFGLSAIELSYSRPNVKGRKIFGDLVPFGKVWRTGANQATTLTFGDTVTIGSTKIAPGKYGLLTIPAEKEWTIIITKQSDVTNPAAYKPEQDVVRINVPAENLPFKVETFTIMFNDVSANSCDLDMIWDKTSVSFPIKTDIDTKIMAQINDAFNNDNHPYFAAAMYYSDNGKDLNKALEWFNKATDQNPTAYFIFYQKARCQAKLGKKQDAIATAQKSMQLAKDQNNNDYVLLNEKLIATLK
jgi:DUF2911 family protein